MSHIRRKIGKLKRHLLNNSFAVNFLQPHYPNLVKYFVVACIVGALFFSVTVIVALQQMPAIDQLASFMPSETTKIYSADDVVLTDLHLEENRVIIPGNKISVNLKMAVIAVEDGNFYKHFGIDPKGILRALTVDILHGQLSQGASTITQQLARNIFLSKKKTISRKVTEAILAMKIEKYYTKDEILEMYLNQVYWGHNCYGVESISLYLFGKSSADLTIGESAMLAGMLKAPEYYSPFKNYERAQKRQRVALNRMVSEKMLTRDQAKEIGSKKLVLVSKKNKKYKAPFFTSYIVEEMVKKYGQEKVYNQGLRVYTTLDYKMQEAAEVVADKYAKIGWSGIDSPTGNAGRFNFKQVALLALDSKTGYVKAMVGGSDYSKNEYNHCVQAHRPAGSSFKPFTYLTALSQGFSPGSILEDAPVNFKIVGSTDDYSPLNYDQEYRGSMQLGDALQESINNIAVRLINLISPEAVIATAKSLGIKSKLQPVLSLTLGSNEVNMLEMTSAYGVLANSGIRVEPTMITKVTDREGNILYQHNIIEKQVYDENLISILIGMMQRVIMYGTGRGAALGDRPVAGKTGTTDDYKDAWFIGFIPQLVTAAWVGNDDNTPMAKVTGGFYPAMMWREFMTEVTKEIPVAQFPTPKNIINVSICKTTGYLPGPTCPVSSNVTGTFQKGYEPEDYCWYNHNLPRSAEENNHEIVPPGWTGRNIYQVLKNNETSIKKE